MSIASQKTPTIAVKPYNLFSDALSRQSSAESLSIGVHLLGLLENGITSYDTQQIGNVEIKVAKLSSWGADWNGNNVAAPEVRSIERARKWIRQMYADVLLNKLIWRDPHVSANEDGNVTFEWWHEDRSLTVYVEPDHTWYVTSWGADVMSEMDDGTADSAEERQDVWKWLMR